MRGFSARGGGGGALDWDSMITLAFQHLLEQHTFTLLLYITYRSRILKSCFTNTELIPR